jgi:YfiH family protein
VSGAPELSALTSPRVLQEQKLDVELPFLVHPEWRAAYPWLAQGITARLEGEPFDMSLFGSTPSALIHRRWAALRRVNGIPHAVHAHQVHAGGVLRHRAGHAGLLVADAADGHATGATGVLMTVSVADCVPVSLVEPRRRAAALLHAGWRGVAAGILENGVAALHEDFGCEPAELEVHFGPAICGACYEVGPEVHQALGSSQVGRAPIDLRTLLAERAHRLGIATAHTTISGFCTRCDATVLHSHRGSARERQVAVLGIRAPLD